DVQPDSLARSLGGARPRAARSLLRGRYQRPIPGPRVAIERRGSPPGCPPRASSPYGSRLPRATSLERLVGGIRDLARDLSSLSSGARGVDEGAELPLGRVFQPAPCRSIARPAGETLALHPRIRGRKLGRRVGRGARVHRWRLASRNPRALRLDLFAER